MLAVVAMKLGMCMQGIYTIRQQHGIKKQQQIASEYKINLICSVHPKKERRQVNEKPFDLKEGI